MTSCPAPCHVSMAQGPRGHARRTHAPNACYCRTLYHPRRNHPGTSDNRLGNQLVIVSTTARCQLSKRCRTTRLPWPFLQSGPRAVTLTTVSQSHPLRVGPCPCPPPLLSSHPCARRPKAPASTPEIHPSHTTSQSTAVEGHRRQPTAGEGAAGDQLSRVPHPPALLLLPPCVPILPGGPRHGPAPHPAPAAASAAACPHLVPGHGRALSLPLSAPSSATAGWGTGHGAAPPAPAAAAPRLPSLPVLAGEPEHSQAPPPPPPPPPPAPAPAPPPARGRPLTASSLPPHGGCRRWREAAARACRSLWLEVWGKGGMVKVARGGW